MRISAFDWHQLTEHRRRAARLEAELASSLAAAASNLAAAREAANVEEATFWAGQLSTLRRIKAAWDGDL